MSSEDAAKQRAPSRECRQGPEGKRVVSAKIDAGDNDGQGKRPGHVRETRAGPHAYAPMRVIRGYRSSGMWPKSMLVRTPTLTATAYASQSFMTLSPRLPMGPLTLPAACVAERPQRKSRATPKGHNSLFRLPLVLGRSVKTSGKGKKLPRRNFRLISWFVGLGGCRVEQGHRGRLSAGVNSPSVRLSLTSYRLLAPNRIARSSASSGDSSNIRTAAARSARTPRPRSTGCERGTCPGRDCSSWLNWISNSSSCFVTG